MPELGFLKEVIHFLGQMTLEITSTSKKNHKCFVQEEISAASLRKLTGEI
jgi:hypothetical protein